MSVSDIAASNSAHSVLYALGRLPHAVGYRAVDSIRSFRPADHVMVLATWGTFLCAAMVAFWFEMRAEARAFGLRSFMSFCFPGEEWKGSSARTDIFFYLIGKVTTPLMGIAGFLVTGVMCVYISRALLYVGLPHRANKSGVVVAIALGLVFFVVNDLSNYLSHLAEHKIPLLWHFHMVHHTATFLSPLTTAREHPLVMAFDGLVSGVLLGFVVGLAHAYYGYSVAEMMGMLATANMFGTLMVLDSIRHSQFPVSFGKLDKLLLSPHMHQLHHSLKEAHWNRNMGNKLSIWDGLFKTAFFPVRGEMLQYGSGDVSEDYQYRSVLRCYCIPFMKVFRGWKANHLSSEAIVQVSAETYVEAPDQMSKIA